MKLELIDLLRCPKTGAPLAVESAHRVGDEIESGQLVAPDGTRYPIDKFVPRFVPPENYADNFGIQWNLFRKTQLDSYTGLTVSHDQFYTWTGWSEGELAGKWVLDVGCGAGRFAEIALAAGANVVALDYSSAVDACRENHAAAARLHVVQGDIYSLPFAPRRFDFVYCLGVLQHTPDVRKSFLALPPQLKAGGKLAVGLYPKIWLNYFWPKYWLRPVTKHIPPRRLFNLVKRLVPILLPVSRLLSRVPKVGRYLRHAIPVANHELDWPLTPKQVYEWAVLNTFDMLAPAHDHPQSAATVEQWSKEAGLTDVWVGRHGFLVGRGIRPAR